MTIPDCEAEDLDSLQATVRGLTLLLLDVAQEDKSFEELGLAGADAEAAVRQLFTSLKQLSPMLLAYAAGRTASRILN